MSQRASRRKNNSRHISSSSQSHNQIAYVQGSDYDSEAPVPISAPENTIEQINFVVIQRYVPNLQTILSIAPSTQLYTFSPDAQQWEKEPTEGPLFICELTPSPLTGLADHALVLLNRKGMENLIILTKDIENVEAVEAGGLLYITIRSLGEMKTLGLFMYDEKNGLREYNWKLITDLWERAMQLREKESALVQSMGYVGVQGEDMVKSLSIGAPQGIGRRLSMTELFGQR